MKVHHTKFSRKGAGPILAYGILALSILVSVPVSAAESPGIIRENPFAVAPAYAVPGDPVSIAVGDFNGDGNLDFVTADWPLLSPGTAVSVFIGNGNGSFAQAVNYDLGCAPQDVAVADVNGDGRLDIVAATVAGGCGDPGIIVLLGNGDGTFQNPIFNTIDSFPTRLVLGDFNSDGRLDVAFVDGYSLYLSFGNGDGTFQPKSLADTAPYYINAIAAGDFNGDGKLDLIGAVVGYQTQVRVLLGNGKGGFQLSLMYAPGDVAVRIVTADFDHDGNLDLAIVNKCPCNSAVTIGTVSILLGHGDGTFHLSEQFQVGAFPLSGAVADINDDGIPDLAVVNEEGVAVFLGDGQGHFHAFAMFAAGDSPTSVAAGQFTHSDKSDLIVGAGDGNTSFLRGNGDGTFVAARDFDTGGHRPTWVTAGDFRHNAKPDLVVTNNCLQLPSCNSSVVTPLRNKGNGTFETSGSYTVGTQTNSVISADFNGDGNLDLAVASNCSPTPNCDYQGTLSILLGNGDGTFQAATYYKVGVYPLSLTAADFNLDGKIDLAISNENDNDVTVLLGNGDGTFQPGMNFPTAAGPVFIVSGDFNRDGKPDLVTVSLGGMLSLLIGNGNGTFQPAVTFQIAAVTTSVAVADLNGDGKLDLVVTGGCDLFNQVNMIAVLLGNGDGTFKPAATFDVGPCPSSVTIADFNGDGKPDLAVSDGGINLPNPYSGNVALFLGRGDGSFEKPIFEDFAEPLMITHADLRKIGAQDLIGVNSNAFGDVRVALHKWVE